MKKNNTVYSTRREKMVELIKQAHPEKDGLLLLFGGFEHERIPFRQESSFYYFTGLNEPGVVFTSDMSAVATLYVPNCAVERAKWVAYDALFENKNAATFGFNAIEPLGAKFRGYQLHPFADQDVYEQLVVAIKNALSAKKSIFTLNPASPGGYMEQRLILARLCEWIPGLKAALVDVSPLVASMRCAKSKDEVGIICEAIEITLLAHEAAACAIEAGVLECEVQASLEYVMTAAGAGQSFPSIVGSGGNSTVLHYVDNDREMKAGDLVVVDIGAEHNFYCADLTRTYPVSGKFTKRQREVYNIVLDTQQYIADLAQPGYWLSNKDHPEKSLNHLAKAYLQKRGYDKYFPHGIGHYLGLDVHDVGDYAQPLKEGDVITIEPGIYISQEKLGIRIEDNYWIVKGGAVCLSDNLPKEASKIESLVQQKFNDDDSDSGSLAFPADESEEMN